MFTHPQSANYFSHTILYIFHRSIIRMIYPILII